MNRKLSSVCVGLLSLSLGALACSKPKTPAASQPVAPASRPASAPSSQPAEESSTGPIKRGAEFTVAAETSLKDVLAKPGEFEGKTVKIRGEVARCCVKKGCWMELTAEGVEQGIRVRFKDYGFFVPLDSAGASALVEGQINTRTLKEATAKHLEDEGAKIVRNKAGEAVELALVATAVELNR